MSDLFHEGVPDAYIARVFSVMRAARWHTYQILTKRPDRMKSIVQKLNWIRSCEYIWLGVSVEDRQYGLPRIDVLRSIKAPIRFLSVEPLLEELGTFSLSGIQWVIVGGESGPHARRMDESWVIRIRDACNEAQVPFFFKQWGGVNKGKNGRTLEGKTYDELPLILDRSTPSRTERRALIASLRASS